VSNEDNGIIFSCVITSADGGSLRASYRPQVTPTPNDMNVAIRLPVFQGTAALLSLKTLSLSAERSRRTGRI
jgi:hypothetical protein